MGSFGFTAAWSAAASLLLVAAVLMHSIGETRPPPTPEDEQPTSLILWSTVPPALGFLTSVVAMGGFLAFASLHAQQVGVTRTSLPLALYGLVVVVCRVVFAKVPDRVPPLRLGAAALVAIAAGMTTAALWATPTGFLLAAVLVGLGVSFSTPAFFTAIFAAVRPSERGVASGTASACIDIGVGGGSVALGIHGAEPRHPVGVRGRGGGRARRERVDARVVTTGEEQLTRLRVQVARGRGVEHLHPAPDGGRGRGVRHLVQSFSTWTGTHGIWLEDLYVTPAHTAGDARIVLRRLAVLEGQVARPFPAVGVERSGQNDEKPFPPLAPVGARGSGCSYSMSAARGRLDAHWT